MKNKTPEQLAAEFISSHEARCARAIGKQARLAVKIAEQVDLLRQDERVAGEPLFWQNLDLALSVRPDSVMWNDSDFWKGLADTFGPDVPVHVWIEIAWSWTWGPAADLREQPVVKKPEWTPPADLDPECLALCRALNHLPGVTTYASCCGHNRYPFQVWFTIDGLPYLGTAMCALNECSARAKDWRVVVAQSFSAESSTELSPSHGTPILWPPPKTISDETSGRATGSGQPPGATRWACRGAFPTGVGDEKVSVLRGGYSRRSNRL